MGCKLDIVYLTVGGLWWSTSECFPWDPAATQTPEGHQEEVGQKDTGHDQENRQGRLREVLEGVLHKVSTGLLKQTNIFQTAGHTIINLELKRWIIH